MIRFITIAIVVSILSALYCSQPEKQDRSNEKTAFWPIFRGDTRLSGYTEEPLPENLRLLWSFKTEDEIKSTPVIAMGQVFIGSTDGNVYALNLARKEKTWTFDTGDDIEAPPMFLDSTIYIGSLNGIFYALDAATGRLKWQFQADDEIFGSASWVPAPSGKDNWILVGSYDNKMYCLSALTGELQWTYETENFINGAPATDGNIAVFGGCDAYLHIVSVRDGRQVAKVDAGSYIAGSAALFNGHAYLGHYGEKLISINIARQSIEWEYGDEENGAAFFSSPAVDDEYVVIGCRDKNLHCVDRHTGKQLWRFRTRDDVDGSPVICKDKVVFGSTDGRLYIVNLNNGRETWSYEIGAAIIGSPAVTGGKIVVGAEDGLVYVFGENK